MMDWNRTKDALLCAAGSAAIWIFCEMRNDFKQMTQAVSGLTAKLEVIAVELNSQADILKDHENRLRSFERGK